MSIPALTRRFQVALIKPSRYDDDGYVLQWWRSFIPSNSLAAVYALVADSRDRHALGDDVEIDIDAMDEINTRIRPARIIERFRRHGNFGAVFLIGVQSNQFPRAVDMARGVVLGEPEAEDSLRPEQVAPIRFALPMAEGTPACGP